MTMMLLGLVLFLGSHSVRVYGEGWRTRMVARLGDNGYKGAYSLLSLLGFVLVIKGYAAWRLDPTVLWASPMWTRHVAALLTLPAFVLLAAAYVPGNSIKARLHHPMVLGIKTWAFAHLVANNTLADLLLFGSFLIWSALSYRAARQRDAAGRVVYAPGRAIPTVLTVVVALAAWVGFAFWGHRAWIGVAPFAG